MNVVDTWTGARAHALRHALRMTNEDFAERLGTSVRAITKWHEKPDLVQTPDLQRALDTMLKRADADERARFDMVVRSSENTAPAESPLPVQVADDRVEVVEERMSVLIDVDADGWATLTYVHDLVNTGTVPFSRLVRELWFETTRGPLELAARVDDASDGDRHVMIQRIHDTASMTKFACLILPALPPGEATTVAYTCSGGRFVDDHYWRQTIARPTTELIIQLRHAGVDALTRCLASEDRIDGSEVSAAEGLSWRRDDAGVAITLARHDLAAGQSVTLRWSTARAA